MIVYGLAPWSELELVDRDVEIGGARLRVPRLLVAEVGHADMGMYAEVVGGGAVRVGDAVRVGG